MFLNNPRSIAHCFFHFRDFVRSFFLNPLIVTNFPCLEAYQKMWNWSRWLMWPLLLYHFVLLHECFFSENLVMGDAIAQRSFRKRKYANSERVLLLERALDLTMFIKQLELLIAQPIKWVHFCTFIYWLLHSLKNQCLFLVLTENYSRIPSNHQSFATNGRQNAQNFFSVKGVWPDDTTHRAEVSKLFNCAEVEGERSQLLSLMVDESDTDSGSEEPMTLKNLHQMLKVFIFCYLRRFHVILTDSQKTKTLPN